MNAYSKDLRLKVLDALERGIPRREISELLGISLSSISRYVKLKASGREIAPKPSPGRKAKILDNLAHKRALWRQLEENDTATLEEHSQDVREGAGSVRFGCDDESRGEKARVDFQKRSLASSGRDEQRRSAFREYVRTIISERFVFVDECSTNISLAPIYARAPRGERAHGKAPKNWGKNVSLICAIHSEEGVKSSMSVEGALDSKAFESYIEHFLTPKLKRGQIVVMDNLSSHKSKRVERLIEQTGATLLFLPPYSPDMNPIEEAFSKLKSILRKVQARTKEALVEATGRALDEITPEDIRGFYTDCGYSLPLQSL